MEGHLRNVVVAHANRCRIGMADGVGESTGADDGHADLAVPFVAGVLLCRQAQGTGRRAGLKHHLDLLQLHRARAHHLLVTRDAHPHPLTPPRRAAPGEREHGMLALGDRGLLSRNEEGR